MFYIDMQIAISSYEDAVAKAISFFTVGEKIWRFDLLVPGTHRANS